MPTTTEHHTGSWHTSLGDVGKAHDVHVVWRHRWGKPGEIRIEEIIWDDKWATTGADEFTRCTGVSRSALVKLIPSEVSHVTQVPG